MPLLIIKQCDFCHELVKEAKVTKLKKSIKLIKDLYLECHNCHSILCKECYENQTINTNIYKLRCSCCKISII
jgi:hypothetical protein